MCAKVMKKSVIANFYQFVFAICQKSRDCKQFATPTLFILWSVPYSSMPFRCMSNIELTLCQPIDSSV